MIHPLYTSTAATETTSATWHMFTLSGKGLIPWVGFSGVSGMGLAAERSFMEVRAVQVNGSQRLTLQMASPLIERVEEGS